MRSTCWAGSRDRDNERCPSLPVGAPRAAKAAVGRAAGEAGHRGRTTPGRSLRARMEAPRGVRSSTDLAYAPISAYATLFRSGAARSAHVRVGASATRPSAITTAAPVQRPPEAKRGARGSQAPPLARCLPLRRPAATTAGERYTAGSTATRLAAQPTRQVPGRAASVRGRGRLTASHAWVAATHPAAASLLVRRLAPCVALV